MKSEIDDQSVAIIAMVGSFPGASTTDEYWENLLAGKESIRQFTEAELRLAGVKSSRLDSASYVRARGTLQNISGFDAEFFGYSPLEADAMDPQHRIFLEYAWLAMEEAGYAGWKEGHIGVFGGNGYNQYFSNNIAPYGETLEGQSTFELALASDKDHLATRVAYKLNLSGPAVTVQTACSTSLVAVHMGVQSLLARDSDIVLAGGVSIAVPEVRGYVFQQGGILSPDGKCRPFDRDARGTVFSSGVGIVVLKRLKDAIRDRDSIHAVIRGTAINNDGSQKPGYTAPSVDGQREVIARAQARAEVLPEHIGFVETHGTATQLGDPIEFTALSEIFGSAGSQRCALGAVKANIGHLGCAAGIAGLIKTAYVVGTGKIPAQPNFQSPNPQIQLEKSPFFINKELMDWPSGEGTRYAGVSSFGIGGTNAHVIVCSPPAPLARTKTQRKYEILPVSARSPEQTDSAKTRLINHLDTRTHLSSDVAYTLQVGRKHFAHRSFALLSGSDAEHPPTFTSGYEVNGAPTVAFMFPGQGSLAIGAASSLYRTERTFRETFDYCSDFFQQELQVDIREILYGTGDFQDRTEQLSRTTVSQPATFAMCIALAQLWRTWGVSPSYLLGHSLGEYTAATVAGIFSLKDALHIISARSKVMQKMPGGAMLSVMLSPRKCREYFLAWKLDLDIAAINGPELCVVAGPVSLITEFRNRLVLERIGFVPLNTSYAFHSRFMADAVEEFSEIMSGFQLSSPLIPILSTVSGTWMTEAQATSFDYWAEHIRMPVNYEDCLQELMRCNPTALLDIGTSASMRLVQHNPVTSEAIVISSLCGGREAGDEEESLALAIGKLWELGVKLDWQRYRADEEVGRVRLPGYPFKYERHWIERPTAAYASGEIGARQSNTSSPQVKPKLYAVGYRRLQDEKPVSEINQPSGAWLIFEDQIGLAQVLETNLTSEGKKVFIASRGKKFEKKDRNRYIVNPEMESDYVQLMSAVEAEDGSILNVLYLWPLDLSMPEERTHSFYFQINFYALLWIAKSIETTKPKLNSRITVVITGLHQINEEDSIVPESAYIVGPRNVIPQESRMAEIRSIDISNILQETNITALSHRIRKEIDWWRDENDVVLRGKFTWTPSLQPLPKSNFENADLLVENGVYVITGGLGGIGRTIAKFLCEKYKATVILLTRREVPIRSSWTDARNSGDGVENSSLFHELDEFAELGGTIAARTVDIADSDAVATVINEICTTFGAITALIHAAGALGGGLFNSRKVEDGREVFASKVEGARSILGALKGREPLLTILFSSNAAIRGGAGQIEYVAANAYLDALALSLSGKSNRVMSINWAAWSEIGMAINYSNTRPVTSESRQKLLNRGLSSQEGVEAFCRAVSSGLPRICVSKSAIQFQSGKRIPASTLPIPLDSPRKTSVRTLHPRPKIGTQYVAPLGETEQGMAALWAQALGLSEVGANDNYFALGGHSLMAVRLTFRVREMFHVDFSLQDLFSAPTVKESSETVLLKQLGNLSSADLAEIFGGSLTSGAE